MHIRVFMVGRTCFCTACYLWVQVRHGTFSRHIICFCIPNLFVRLSRFRDSSCRRRCRWEVDRSLPTLLRLGGSTFVPSSSDCRHLSSILACSVVSIRCLDSTSAATGVKNPGLSMTAFENGLKNAGEFPTFFTVRSTKVSKPADRRL